MIIDIIVILWIHFISDFLLQTSWMAMNKSRNTLALLVHCFVYTIPFICLTFDSTLSLSFDFVIINGCCHFIIDFITSRFTSKLYKEEKYRAFFSVIGLDQTIHMTILILTYWWIPKG
jgi:hypothetical protein